MALLQHICVFTLLMLTCAEVIEEDTQSTMDASSAYASSIKQSLLMLDDVSKTLSTLYQTSQSQWRDVRAMMTGVQNMLQQGSSPTSPHIKGRDCTDISENFPNLPSGIYLIKPDDSESFEAFCDLDTDEGGWTVFQRRIDGSVDFYQNWTDYKHGFGSVDGEHWLGLDKLHDLTSTGRWELHVDLEDHRGNTVYANYDDFYIGNEDALYTLHIGQYNGTAYDSLRWNNKFAFSTKDRDNDISELNCARLRQSAWWYKYCTFADLNSDYSGEPLSDNTGIIWYPWTHQTRRRFIEATKMKARRVV
ncbi:fibrinogen-like protein A [Amphiura filiformis]|uniref:fibrinogen-like protein A n=1 Tax=Amphiura filiformis TaxID=82378 RepID=UPI003B2199B8